MEWDQILRFSTFKVKHVSMPKEDNAILRIQLVKGRTLSSFVTGAPPHLLARLY
jgi:hypothetical protein